VTTRFIVHADDFGLAESVNRGIVTAAEKGIVRSTSIMACGRAFERGVALLQKHSLCVGIHLTLDEETPVLPPGRIPSLVTSEGHFHSRSNLLKRLLLSRSIRLEEVYAELEAQFQRCIDAGLKLSHVDGHGHVHVYPRIAPIVAELAKRLGLANVRIPRESLRYWGGGPSPGRQLNKLIVYAFSAFSESTFRSAGLASPARFYGISHGGRVTEQSLQRMLRHAPEGAVVEIMCHPGFEDSQALLPYQAWNYTWQSELNALLSTRLPPLFAARGSLVSFKELHYENP